MSQCVARGNGWLDDRTGEILRRVDASRIRFVSSFITDLEIRAIGIVRLPDVIEEKLVASASDMQTMMSAVDPEATKD